LKENIALVVAILAILAAFMYADTGEGYRVYDCGMAEWHPDIPLEVRKQCRELKHQEWKKENEGKVQTNLYENRKDIRGT